MIDISDGIWAIPRDGKPLPEGWRAPSHETLREYYANKALGIVATNRHARSPVAPLAPDEINSRRTKEVVNKLFSVAEAKRKAGRNLVGLAAPQIGENVDIFIADVNGSQNGAELGELAVFVNAQATILGDEVCTGAEGCFTCPHIFGRVECARTIGVTAWRPDGQSFEAQYENFAARVFLHERAHIKGEFFPDKVIRQGGELHWVPIELRKEHGKHTSSLDRGEESEWPYIMPKAQWWAMRMGSFSLDNFYCE